MSKRKYVKSGVTNHPLGTTWTNMKQRCFNRKHPAYYIYGGRGIIVCDRWKNSFQNFLEDMGPKPSAGHSIDRFPDKDGNYQPGNCRWATLAEQAANKNPDGTFKKRHRKEYPKGRQARASKFFDKYAGTIDFIDLLSEANATNRSIFQMRLQGHTLQEIGNTLGITSEAVRQRQVKFIESEMGRCTPRQQAQ